MKAYFILRTDLNMSPAKLAVQVGHGVALMYNNPALANPLKQWYGKDEMRKIVVKVDNEEKMNNIWNRLVEDKLFAEKIYDNGYTELDGFTYTGIVLLADEVPNYIKRLRLYTS